MPESVNPELVLLIHGTYAGPVDRQGNHVSDDSLWWREGGEVWNRVRSALPEGISPAARNEEFFWTGKNSQRDRREAGRKLYSRLKKLEAEGRKYHLVGHSHGGSVIWNCLLESVRERFKLCRMLPPGQVPLPGLKSWTTIGTPFLQLKPLKISGWLGSIAELNAFVLPIALVGFLFWYCSTRINAQMNAMQLQIDDALAQVDGLRGRNALLDSILEFADNDVALVAIAFGLILAVVSTMTMGLYFWVSAVRLEAVAVREEARIRKQAFVDFSGRWLGIWSKHDEAINGLRATMELQGRIAPRITIAGGSVFDYDRRLRAYRFITRFLIAPFFNFLISRPGDRMIWRGIQRNLQGNDRPGCVVSTVTKTPIEDVESGLPSLPEEVDKRLVTASDAQLAIHSKTVIPKLREFLSQAAWSGKSPVGLLAGGEVARLPETVLVHTSYLHDREILQLIAGHTIGRRKGKVKRRNGKWFGDNNSLDEWYRSFRSSIRSHLQDNEELRKQALPLLGARNARGSISLFLSFVSAVSSIVLEGSTDVFDEVQDPDLATFLRVSLFATSVIALSAGRSAVKRSRLGARGRRISRLARAAGLLAVLVTVTVLLSRLD